jgi:hypothetical protein
MICLMYLTFKRFNYIDIHQLILKTYASHLTLRFEILSNLIKWIIFLFVFKCLVQYLKYLILITGHKKDENVRNYEKWPNFTMILVNIWYIYNLKYLYFLHVCDTQYFYFTYGLNQILWIESQSKNSSCFLSCT